MKKSLLVLCLAGCLMVGAPTVSQANHAIEIIDNDMQGIAISVSESVLHVAGANGLNLEIYNITGVKIMSFKVEGQDKKYELNLPKGCYIVKVGKVVRKISIR